MAKKIIALIVAVAVLAGGLGMVGCAPEEVTPTPTPPTPTPTPPAPPEEPRILRVAVADLLGMGVLDPVLTPSAYCQKIVGPAFDSLVGVDVDDKPVPALATSWEPNEDYTVWTIHLREGVQFHDDWGEMTAEDVEFSLRRFISPECLAAQSPEMGSVISDIVIVDRYTLEIHLSEPRPVFVEYYLRDGPTESMGMVMSKAYWEAVGAEGFLEHPIGTGQWKFVEFRPGDSVTWEAVDEHWSGVVPGFDRVILMEVPEESTRVAMLERGDADLIDVGIDRGLMLDKEGYDVVLVKEVGRTPIFFFDTWRPEAIEANNPLTLREVRKALSLAINRQEINETMFGGFFDPVPLPGLNTGSTGVGLPEETCKQWREWAKVAYRYDPDEARRLLAEAGFPEGFEVTFWSYNSSRGPFETALIEVVAGYWEAIGVKTNIIPTDYNGYFRPMTRTIPHPDELVCTANMHSYVPEMFPIPKLGTAHGTDHPNLLLDINDKHVMELCSLVQTESDPDLVVVYFNELAGIIGESYIEFGLFYSCDFFVVSDSVAEWETIKGISIPSLWVQYFKPAK
jgi:peptide/nickel transport system substrate-binding protein